MIEDLASTDFLEKLSIALCYGIVCSHRKYRPCDIHKEEAKWIQKRLFKGGEIKGGKKESL